MVESRTECGFFNAVICYAALCVYAALCGVIMRLGRKRQAHSGLSDFLSTKAPSPSGGTGLFELPVKPLCLQTC
jgi:hypothetical protein